MSTLETNLIQPATGTALQVGASGDTITIPSGATIVNSGTATGFGANTPAFSVYASGGTAIANATITKLSFGTEIFDTDSAFASDKFTVPAGEGGKYFFYASWQTATATDFNEQRIYMYKNGVASDPSIQGFQDHYGSIQISKLLDLSATDYIEVYAYQNSGGSINTLGTDLFQGYKLLG